VIAAPTQCVATLLDAVTLDALAAVGANPDAYLTLTVERDGVELSLYGWPGDPSAAAHLAGIVARVARAVETAVAAAGGDLHAHPEVHALAAWDARRKRIARRVLLAVAVFMLLTAVGAATWMIPRGP